nr:phage portal protein [Levilactobacillus humaensis]
MGFWKNLFNREDHGVQVSPNYKMVTTLGNNFFSWNGKVYESDIVRSAIEVKANAIGKAVAKHIRAGAADSFTENPDVYIKFLLTDPNPIMTGQMLQEKLITQLELNNNAFAYVQQDANGFPNAIWPITPNSVEALQNAKGTLFLRFYLRSGQIYTFPYSQIIHLRKDFNENDIFGESNGNTLAPLMEIVNTTDQGIVSAIKSSGVIRWLLKYQQSLRPEDVKKNTEEFVANYLASTDGGIGAAGIDSSVDAVQIHPDDYVPNEKQMEATTERIYSIFHISKPIIQASYTENQWISYYESQIEPFLRQMSEQWTRVLFNRRQRSFGNSIVFESNDLSYASMQTKLQLVQFVDRAIMSPNEVRGYFNLPPVAGGDELLLRKDTGTANDPLKGGEENDESTES